MTSGQTNTVVAKETKAKLKRVDAFRNDQDGLPGNPRPYSDTEAWRMAMGEKLKYKTSELRRGLEGCLTAPRYDGWSRSRSQTDHIYSKRARKIVGTYLDGRPFSVQLVAAVCSLAFSLVAK